MSGRQKDPGFYAVIWCPDCTGQDFYGCFDGGTERLGPFATREEADEAGATYTDDSIWLYDVEEEAVRRAVG